MAKDGEAYGGILDRHHPSAEKEPESWYTAEVREQRWIEDWTMPVWRYKGNRAAVGADLSNRAARSGDLG